MANSVQGVSRADSKTHDLLTMKEVRDRLRCGRTTVYELFERGEIRGFRLSIGGGIRIFAESVDELMTRNANKMRQTATPRTKQKEPVRPPQPRKAKGVPTLADSMLELLT